MKIIDFERKGNVIRFSLGEKTAEYGWTDASAYEPYDRCSGLNLYSDTYYGDDWNDAPYQDNAGSVYDRFVKGYRDLVVPFDYLVLEPCESFEEYSKEDMRDRKVPCIILVPPEVLNKARLDYYSVTSFDRAKKSADTIKIYFGDDESVLDLNL